MSDILKWLGGLNGNEAALSTAVSLCTPVVVIVWRVVASARKQRAADMTAADKPTTPTATGPILPPPSAELLELRTRLREVERDQDIGRLRWRYEASLEERQELRIELERLMNALTTERRRVAELQARLAAAETPPESLPTPLRPPRLP